MQGGRAAAAAMGAAAGRKRKESMLQDNLMAEEFEEQDLNRQVSLSDEANEASDDDVVLGDPWYRRLTKSTEFSLLANTVILLNGIAMWLQADYPEWDFWLVNTLFLFFFVIELTLRLTTYGCYGFFFDPDDMGWNIFDFSIVTMGALDWSSRFIVSDRNAATQFITVVRILRILRVLRVLRVFKFAKPLMRLIQGLLDSVATVFYIMLFISIIIMVYGIMCTTTIGQNAELWADVGEDPEQIRAMFGSMTNSSLTLFQFLTLDDWSNITRVIAKVWPIYYFIFIFYVLITAFVILSLLTGTMAEHMSAVRVDEEGDDQRHQVKDVYKAFKDLDTNDNDFLTVNEFKDLHAHADIEENLKVTLMEFEPFELFQCFDTDGDGRLTWFEFKNGMMELRKGVSKKQYFKLQAMMQRVVEQVDRKDTQTMEMSSSVKDAIDDIGDKTDFCHETLDGVDTAMDKTLKLLQQIQNKEKLS